MSSFVKRDGDFGHGEVLEFFLRLCGESFGAISNEVGADDGEGEVDIVKEAVRPSGGGVGNRLAVRVESGNSLKLDEIKTELVGGELLGLWVGAVLATSEEVVVADERIPLP